MMGQVWRRLQLLFSVGRSSRVSRDMVQASLFVDDTPPPMMHVEPYGLSYFPPSGGEVYCLFPNGDRSQGMVIVHGHKQYRMSLEQGEIALHDDVGNHVHIQRGGIIEVKASAKVIADTPLVDATGDVHIAGNLVVAGHAEVTAGYYGQGGGIAKMSGGINVTGSMTCNGKNVSDSHTHTCPDGTTSGVN